MRYVLREDEDVRKSEEFVEKMKSEGKIKEEGKQS